MMSEELKNKKNDYLLELALEEQLEHDEELKQYEAADEPENHHVFSEKHEERMQEIFKMAEKAEKKPKRMRRYRQMAAGFALLFCISAFSVTQVEAFRLPIIRFFTEIKEKATLFGTREDGVSLTEHFKEYEPQYMPDGFAVLRVEEEEKRLYIEYLNNQNHQKYKYYFFKDTGDSAIDTEDGEMVEIQINGNQAYAVQKEDTVRILMDKEGRRFYLTGNIPYEEAIKIMESIEL